MKFCSKCGAPCGDNVNTCPECGNIFPENSDSTANAYGSTWQNNDAGPNNPNNGPNPYGGSNGGSNPYSGPNGANPTYGGPNQTNNPYNAPYNSGYNGGSPMTGPTERSIPLCILYSVITCGIYGIYWMIKLNDEINPLAGEPNATSGGMVFLLSIVTCGIYSYYWMYKMGERCDRINRVNGNSNILFLLVTIFGFGIISYCLMQDTLNKVVRSHYGR